MTIMLLGGWANDPLAYLYQSMRKGWSGAVKTSSSLFLSLLRRSRIGRKIGGIEKHNGDSCPAGLERPLNWKKAEKGGGEGKREGKGREKQR